MPNEKGALATTGEEDKPLDKRGRGEMALLKLDRVLKGKRFLVFLVADWLSASMASAAWMASRAALLEKLMLSRFVGESSTGLRGNTMGDGVVFKGLRLLSRGVEFFMVVKFLAVIA